MQYILSDSWSPNHGQVTNHQAQANLNVHSTTHTLTTTQTTVHNIKHQKEVIKELYITLQVCLQDSALFGIIKLLAIDHGPFHPASTSWATHTRTTALVWPVQEHPTTIKEILKNTEKHHTWPSPPMHTINIIHTHNLFCSGAYIELSQATYLKSRTQHTQDHTAHQSVQLC